MGSYPTPNLIPSALNNNALFLSFKTHCMKHSVLFLFVITAVYACSSSKPYSKTNKQYKKQAAAYAAILKTYPVKDSAGLPYAADFVGTTNFSMRKPNYVIIHHTAQNSCEQTLRTFTLPRTQVSSHYVICKDGTVHHMLHDLLRGHHAGVSKWGNTTDLNSSSIGIEIDNNGSEVFTDAQITSLQTLLGRLKNAYQIPTGNFIGHADIAPGRKVDPNNHFPWQQLADNGYGYWYDTTNIQVPPGFDAIQALRIVGYNIAKPQAAIQSYRLHFTPQDSSKTLTEADKKILTSLVTKYQ